MSWRVFGERIETADMSAPFRVYMPVEFNSDFLLKAIRTWFVIYNDPVFTSIEMRIYSNRSNAPGKLITTSSNVQLKADVHTEDNAAKGIYFEWDTPKSFEAGDRYYLVPFINGYTGTEASHIAWVKAWPHAVYTTGLSNDYESLGIDPYHVAFIGAKL